ncbi:hypothetical protein AB9F29_19360 [Falsihalocynthiibacter sp. S25ZX9]|uniref:hypothetical protein n=1 Tax=Falsihalocynthiibacter sp. S25ZX9 TaxID=3240870 RepID=UPI00350ED401
MVLYPTAIVFLLIWLVLTIRDPDNGLVMAIAVIPFGMFAALRLGGLSIILANLLAVFTIGVLIIRYVGIRHRLSPLRLPMSSVYLWLFAIYALFSALILVRFFAGKFLVFPLSVTFKGSLTSAFYPSTMVSLQPSNSNISQSFYILLTAMFFMTAVLVMRRRGLHFGEKGLAWAAGLNVLLGAMDLAQLDSILAFIRTADYSLNNHHMVAGMARVIGGYSEAAAFGAVSAAFFSYFAMSFLIGNRARDAGLALGNLICALLAFSSTGILSLAAAGILILLHAPVFIKSGMSRQFAQSLVIAAAAAVISICLLLVLTSAETFATKILNSLLFSKGTSMSGLERAAWASGGFDAFYKTWGLGAGAGSLRANGFFAVLLGNVGLPGTLAFTMFLLHGIGAPIQACERSIARPFYAGRVAALTLLASMLVSATGPNPTLLLVSFVCVAVVAREFAAHRNAIAVTQQYRTA